MRRSGEWMVLADERVLEFIREEESGAPKEMAESGYVRFSRQYISRRCKKLVDHTLLRHLGNGVYIITDAGEAYLDEEYDAERGVYLNRDMVDAEDREPAADAEGTDGG
jgi:predicted transcriptional regulator